MSLLPWLLLVLALLLLTRLWLLHRPVQGRYQAPFDGVIYRVGRAAVAERGSERPAATVIAMHGFVENLHYFTRYYDDPALQLITLNSADYNLPVPAPRLEQPAWAETPQAPVGSVEYDAEVLLQALTALPRSERIRIHGHSRGGAVVVEAARQRPELFDGVEVVLEAPLLPQAVIRRRLSLPEIWLLPFLAVLWRRTPLRPPGPKPDWGPLDDPHKRALIESMPFNPRSAAVMARNILHMQHWLRRAQPPVRMGRGCVLVPERDQVLEAEAMAASAARLPGLEVVPVPDTGHFVLDDHPEAIPPLP